MSTSESIHALRRANPRTKDGFAERVGVVTEAVHAQIAARAAAGVSARNPKARRQRLRVLSGAVVALATATAAAVVLTVGSTGGGPGVEDAAAAIRKATTVTAASADRSGVALVRMTHNAEPWAEKTIRWNGSDVEITGDTTPSKLLVVDGVMYAQDLDGSWLSLGSPKSIDPGTGTTPDEHLAAVREDIGGATLRRITEATNGLTTRHLSDGSTVYRGTVAAGLIARESGFKEGRPIRVLPFGYVAHDEAADPTAPLNVAVTVAADGIVSKVTVTWGSSSKWTYTVTYSDLGTTPAPVAPANARPSLIAPPRPRIPAN
jgi:hypothetical protein